MKRPHPAALLAVGFGVVISIATSPPLPDVDVRHSVSIEPLSIETEGEFLCFSVIASPNQSLRSVDPIWDLTVTLDVENVAYSSGAISLWAVEGCRGDFLPGAEEEPLDATTLRGAVAGEENNQSLWFYGEVVPDEERHYLLWLEGEAVLNASGEISVAAIAYEEPESGTPDFTLEVQ